MLDSVGKDIIIGHTGRGTRTSFVPYWTSPTLLRQGTGDGCSPEFLVIAVPLFAAERSSGRVHTNAVALGVIHALAS